MRCGDCRGLCRGYGTFKLLINVLTKGTLGAEATLKESLTVQTERRWQIANGASLCTSPKEVLYLVGSGSSELQSNCTLLTVA